MNNRVRRTLLSLATVGFALIASSMGATAGGGPGGGGPCGYCLDEVDFTFCEGNQALETECLTICGIQQVAECWHENPACFDGTSFDVWIECGFLD